MIRYKQFAPFGTDEFLVAEQVRDHIHSVLAADDDPTNDDTPVSIYYTPGDNGRTKGTWVYGEAEGEIQPYPEVSPEDYEIIGATKAGGQ